MIIFEDGKQQDIVVLKRDSEGKRDLCEWVNCEGSIDQCQVCPAHAHTEESKKRFPEGLTYQDALEFLGSK